MSGPHALAAALVVLLTQTGCVSAHRYDQALLAYSEASVQAKASAEQAAALKVLADAHAADADAWDRERARMATELQQLTDVAERRAEELAETQARLVAAIDDAGALEADVDAMREALIELERRKADADASLAEYRDLVARFQSLIDAGTLRVRVVEGRMLVELATDILFAPGSASVSAEGASNLREVATILAGIEGRQFQVAGHTDNVPIRTQRFPSNWELGSARATAVLQLLAQGGLEPSRLSAASFAEFQPTADNSTPEGRAQNRRIEIVVVPDLSRLPGFDELAAVGQPQ